MGKKKDMFQTDEEREAEEAAKKKAEKERQERERLLKELAEELLRVKEQKKLLDAIEMKAEKERNELVQKHCKDFISFHEEDFNYFIDKRTNDEWQVYTNCDHKPFPNDPPSLNTFLYSFKLVKENLNIENVFKEIETILDTIRPVEEYIHKPLKMDKKTVNNLIEAKQNYYADILKIIDNVTFDAIMDLQKYHTRISKTEVEILKKSKNFEYWLWGWAFGGRKEKKIKRIIERPKREADRICVTLPGLLQRKKYHLRIFYTAYDPYSFQSESYSDRPYPSDRNLCDELEFIRRMEINTLWERYDNDYDEDAMPWWYVMDEKVAEERKKKELAIQRRLEQQQQAKKPKRKRKGESSGIEQTVSSADEKTEPSKEDTSDLGFDMLLLEEEEEEEEKEDKTTEEDRSELTELDRTPILYTRSMLDLMAEREKEYKGPVYYPEVEPIHYLNNRVFFMRSKVPDIDKNLIRAEKNTAFGACMYTELSEFDEGDIMKNITKSLCKTDKSEITVDAISLANRREFLDWKSIRDKSPDREAIREELEQLLFGDSEATVKDGKITFVKRNPKLRSIKELLKEMDRQANVPPATAAPNTEPEAKIKSVDKPTVLQPSTKLASVDELKQLEAEIASLLDNAWHDYAIETVDKMFYTIDNNLINLRQFSIVGGTYQFDFFEDEPQPVVNKELFKMQIHYGDYELKRVPFVQVPKVRFDLSMEVERKMSLAKRKQSMRSSRATLSAISSIHEQEDEYSRPDDDLLWFSLKLPTNVIFFETPLLVRWDQGNKCWTTDDTYDVKWAKEKDSLLFKLGKSGPFALAAMRFSNLPYRHFRLKPSLDWNQDPSIALDLHAKNCTITFVVKEDIVKVTKFEHENTTAISHLIDVPFALNDLIDALRYSGIDVFPDWDSFQYVGSSYRKLRCLEEHLYHCIGYTSPAIEYKRSKLNFSPSARDDKLFFQLKEMLKQIEGVRSRTVKATPRKVYYVEITPKGKPKEDPNEPFSPDLLSFVDKIASEKAKRRMEKASKRTISTIIKLVTATKLLSY